MIILCYSNSQLELLSTIQEIRGPLRIQGWVGVSFPYLKNLRLVGDTDNTLPITCGGPRRFLYQFVEYRIRMYILQMFFSLA